MMNHCEQDPRAADLSRKFGAMLDQLVKYYTDQGAGLAPDLLAACLTRHLMREAVAAAADGYHGIGKPFDVEAFAALAAGFVADRLTRQADPDALAAVEELQKGAGRLACRLSIREREPLLQHIEVIMDELAAFKQSARAFLEPDLTEAAHA